MNFKDFQEQYGARFRPLGEADGLSEWMADIERLEIEAETMRLALDGIADSYNPANPGPRLPVVMGAYRREEKRRYSPPERVCRCCGNSGWGLGLRTREKYYLDPVKPEIIHEYLYITAIPCYCPIGGEVSRSALAPAGAPQELRDRLRRYVIVPGNNTGDIDDTRCLNLLREIQGACEAPRKALNPKSEIRNRGENAA